MALWYIGVVGLRLCWTVFYDDFTLLCRSRLRSGTGTAAEALFELFGMWFAKEGAKAVEFSTEVRTLGLLLKLGKARDGFLIGHTAERREEIRTALMNVLDSGEVEPKQAERLRGRMQWFEGYAFGRIAQHSLRILGNIALKKQRVVKVDSMEREAMEFLVARVSEAGPIKLSAISLDTFLVFTDGACESDERKGGIGGVLVNEHGQCIHHFSYQVPDDFMALALSKSENPIYELELLPVYVALLSWKQILKFHHVVFYLDNDAARAAVCKGVGATDLAQRIVKKIMGLESGLELKTWYARVPSHSNVSDGPSRLDCSEVLQLGSTRTEVDLKHFLEDLQV